MSIISVAAAVSMRRTHEAFEKRLKEVKDREYRRREEEKRRNEESRRHREEERRRDEENKRRQAKREKETLYAKHRRETVDEVSAFRAETTFSANCLHSKDEVFDKIVSYDGYAYRCADGSSITEDVDGQYYVKKLSNGVTQTYKELGARELGANAEVMYLLSREDLPDGRSRVYDTKCRYSTSDGRYKTYTDEENKYFISYECDADGSYRRYDVTEEKEDKSYADYRHDIPYKTILVDDVKAETKMYTLSKENTEHKGVSLELEKMKKKVKNRQLSGVAVADKIAEDIIFGREKRTITYEVGQELSDKYKREYALSKKQNEGK